MARKIFKPKHKFGDLAIYDLCDCKIVRELKDSEYDKESAKQKMYEIKFHDGYTIRAFEDEIVTVDDNYPMIYAGYNYSSLRYYYKLWRCLKKAIDNEDELGCHANDIVVHLGKVVSSGFTYHDSMHEAWCDYFLGRRENW